MMEKNNIIKKKKEIINELLVDPNTYQYVKDDKRNTSNDYEISVAKTTDQLSQSVGQSNGNSNFNNVGYSSLFFYESDDKLIQTEEVLKKTELKNIVSGDNDEVSDKIIQIINNIEDNFTEEEKYLFMKEVIKKFKIKEIDKELIEKLITFIKKTDNLL